MKDFDGFMMVNSDILKNFSATYIEQNFENTLHIKSIKQQTFSEIMESGLLVEIVGRMKESGLLEDE